MIIIDLETSGTDPKVHGIVSIGAVMIPEGKEFYSEVQLLPEQVADPDAFAVNGYTEEQVRDPARPKLEDAMLEFHEWAKQASDKILSSWNTNFDVHRFMENAYSVCEIEWTYGFRSVDLHSIAFFLQSLIDAFVPKHDGYATVGLNWSLKWAGLKPEPEPHNALTGAQKNLELWNYFGDLVVKSAPKELVIASKIEKPTCPNCGKDMNLRKPKPNQHWNAFWGCSGYPICQETKVFRGTRTLTT